MNTDPSREEPHLRQETDPSELLLAPEPHVFAEPWQAHAFAMVVELHARGQFTWPEWAAALSQQIRAAGAAGDADRGDTYYTHWLLALETLTIERGLGDPAELQALQQQWIDAAARTPHGQPITLA